MKVNLEDIPRTEIKAVNPQRNKILAKRIKGLLQTMNAVLVAHYYTSDGIQELAETTGGCVSDSLEMARFGMRHKASVIIVAGVRFMGETAKILSPEKTVLMINSEATCSLDLGCPIVEFEAFCDANSEREIVVYANTSALVKARSDWVVTSSIALDVVSWLHSQGKKILWAPDKHLGRYIQNQTGADMMLWDGSCIVHEEFKAQGVSDLVAVYPEAAVLVHPESPLAVLELADFVGSTTGIIKAAKRLPNKVLIISTDRGLFYKLRKVVPDKTLILAPTAGDGATCHSCGYCPWMAMNDMEWLATLLENHSLQKKNAVHVDSDVSRRAQIPLNKMVEFSQNKR